MLYIFGGYYVPLMNRKYNVDDNFFYKIDNERKAYWLGFIIADGYINERTGQDRLILDLGQKDIKHLEQYVNDISFQGPINNYTIKSGSFKGYEHSSVAITSQRLVDNLALHGCTPRKSLTLVFPKLKRSLIRHFIRGYFDGDGSVFISNEKHWRSGNIDPVIHFRFCGTYDFLIKVSEEVNLGCTPKVIKNSKAFELAYKRNKKARMFYDYLYDKSKIYLSRKRDVFKTHLQI